MSLPVAILAGGLGTRLGPLTARTPKALMDVNGKPFIFRQIELLQRHGIDQIVLCLGHLGSSVQQAVGDGSRWGLSVRYSFEGDTLMGTAGAIKLAAAWLGEAFFVLYGDSYLEIDYRAVQAAFQSSGRLGLMTVYRNEDQWDRSNVCFEGQRIIRYSKRQPDAQMRHIDYGLGVLKAQVLELVPAGQKYDLATLYERLVAMGELAGFEARQRFYEIGSIQGLQELREHLAPPGEGK